MKISIIIVNYNVKHFLEQCLLSVEKAIQGITAEVFVVDNVSVDGSVEMVRAKFPWVQLIANTENVGFSKGNNQAIRVAKGEYVLLLNPDTLVEEDTFTKCIEWMDAHPEGGGLGVKMVDGKGVFLPESKRGIPYPLTSFFKISGIYRLFPKSKKINHYYLGHLSNEANHEVEILSGAYMLMRKQVLDEVGLLDEDFFMYGEDIDLSWRIIKAGYKNYYLADTRIIHYKGESTKKGSLNYVYVFYQAMVIFANKHFSGSHAQGYQTLIRMAIWMRAGLSFGKRILQSVGLPLLDLTLTWLVWWWLKIEYTQITGITIPDALTIPGFLVTGLIWWVMGWVNGLYDFPLKTKSVFKTILRSAVLVLIIYSLLPETMRFSRLLIVMGSLLAMVVFYVNRWWLLKMTTDRQSSGKVLLVGSELETQRIIALREGTNWDVSVINTDEFQQRLSANQMNDYVRVKGFGEVVFCAKDLSSAQIISAMAQLSTAQIEMKIAPPESLFIIGSQHIEQKGDAGWVDLNSISLKENQRWKRLLDVGVGTLGLLLYPIGWLLLKNKTGWWKRCFLLIMGRRTVVGYQGNTKDLPLLPQGLITCVPVEITDAEVVFKYNSMYAKDYSVKTDWKWLVAKWRGL